MTESQAAPVEWSVAWEDSRMPVAVRGNRASCRDEADARSLAEACGRNGELNNVRIQTRTVTVTPWATIRTVEEKTP